jgi:hypothetical protein
MFPEKEMCKVMNQSVILIRITIVGQARTPTLALAPANHDCVAQQQVTNKVCDLLPTTSSHVDLSGCVKVPANLGTVPRCCILGPGTFPGT